jgi:hypothetical protein
MAGCGRSEGGGHGYSDVCGQPEWGPESQIYRCRRCLLAELELVTQWRPMETAPKDGTALLGMERHPLSGEAVMIPVRWDAEECRWRMAWSVWPDETDVADPELWTHLPAPPTRR